MKNEVENDAAAAYREVTTGSVAPVSAKPASTKVEQNDRYAITPEREEYLRKVIQIATEEKARKPDTDERVMRLRERITIEEKDAHENREAQRTAPFRRAEEILNNWSKQEIGGWYDKQAQIINDYYGRSISELGTGPRKSYDQQKAELEHAFAEAGVSGKAPTPHGRATPCACAACIADCAHGAEEMTKEEITAYHEAGHAVAGLILSAAADVRASIEPDDETWGRTNYSFPKVAPVSRAVIVFAGPMAAWRVMDDGEDGKDSVSGQDAEHLLDLIDEIEPDPAELNQMLVALGRMADELLDNHWASVVRVAEALLRNKSLNAAEILELHTEH